MSNIFSIIFQAFDALAPQLEGRAEIDAVLGVLR